MARTAGGVVGLFTGIGGFEYGFAEAGFKPLLFCENDPAASAVLKQRFPKVAISGDVRDLSRLPDNTRVVTAGFPCQDLSQVGRAGGINGKKSGLVAEVIRLLRAQAVPHVLLENVPFMLRLHKGHAIQYLTHELEKLGYRWAYRVIDSRAFGLPQRRLRVFLLAFLDGDPGAHLFRTSCPEPNKSEYKGKACGFYWTEGNRGLGWAIDAVPTLKTGSALGIPSPPAMWLPNGAIVTPDIRDAERLQGFPQDWTSAAEEVAPPRFRWRLVGNAVTTNVARWLGLELRASAGKVGYTSRLFDAASGWPNAAQGGPGKHPEHVSVSTWPVSMEAVPLADFLQFEPHPLSTRALTGFTTRLSNSSLRYPPEFMDALLKACGQSRSERSSGEISKDGEIDSTLPK